MFPLSNGAGGRALAGGDLRGGCWCFAMSAAPILKPGGKNVLNPRISLSWPRKSCDTRRMTPGVSILSISDGRNLARRDTEPRLHK